jgi:hypothetical protein
LNELQSMLEHLKKDEDIVYLWELFQVKDYSRQRYSEWLTEYKDNEKIKEMSDTIKEILETRAVKWAITNKLNPTFTIFHLKNNYKESWKEKTEVDSNIKWELSLWWILNEISVNKPNLKS